MRRSLGLWLLVPVAGAAWWLVRSPRPPAVPAEASAPAAEAPAPLPPASAAPAGQAAPPAAPPEPVRPPAPEPWEQALNSLASWTSQGFSYQDPRLPQAASAVRHHLPQALERWRTGAETTYVKAAIVRTILQAVTEEDRTLVLASLEEHPFLITAVVDHQWVADAHPVLRQGLGRDLPWHHGEENAWTEALASVAVPEDLPSLVPAILRCRDGRHQAKLIDALRGCPGFQAESTIRSAWGVRYPREYVDRQHGLVLDAARIGIRDAFAAAGDALAGSALNPAAKKTLTHWLATQPALAEGTPTAEWFHGHEARFAFRDGAWHLTAPLPEPAAKPAATPLKQPPPLEDPPAVPPPPGLAADADGAALLVWLDAKAAQVKDLKSFKGSDPVVMEFAALPPALLADLIAAQERYRTAGWPMRSLIAGAIPKLVRAQHHDLVLAQVEAHPELIRTLVPHGWGAEAAPILRRLLVASKLANHLEATVETVQVLASVGDPGDYDLMRRTFLRCHYGYWQVQMARSLAKLPDFNLEDLVRTAWQQPVEASQRKTRDALALFAAKAGIAEALPIVVAYATGGQTGWNEGLLRQESRQFLAATFKLEAEEQAIAAWWRTAKDQVRWDAERKIWVGPGPQKPAADPVNF